MACDIMDLACITEPSQNCCNLIAGDWPDIDVLVDLTSAVNVTNNIVTETTKGEAAMTHFTLIFESVPTSPLPISATETEVSSTH